MTSMVICEIIHKDSLEACLWTRLVDYLYECGLAFFRLVFHGAERVFLFFLLNRKRGDIVLQLESKHPHIRL